MTTLGDSRSELESTVSGALDTDTITVFDHIPKRLIVPAAMIVLGSPYLEGGETFGEFRVRYDLDLIPDIGGNDTQTTDVETMIEAVILAMVQAGYAVETVAQPRMMSLNNTSYLAASVTVTDRVTLI